MKNKSTREILEKIEESIIDNLILNDNISQHTYEILIDDINSDLLRIISKIEYYGHLK